ncbi:VID27-like protein [Notolabrus celidotus]|uniref:VID27-like protein n=1 Tax=Notolabrus celidotus TaxID=1203425 RepID=UPI00148FB761|nr:VID27-like protein [Notolabrus celidotus]
MASSAAVNRPPPAHPGPNPESLPSYNHSRIPNPGLQDPGLQGPSQDLGPHVEQSSVLEPKVIFETAEQDDNDGPLILNDNSVVKTCKERRHSLRFSSSDSVLMSDNFLVFSTPAVQQSRSQRPEMENESDASDMGESQRGQSMTLTEHVPSASSEQEEKSSSEQEEKSSSEQEEKSSSEQEEKSSSEQEEKSSSEQEEKSSAEQENPL